MALKTLFPTRLTGILCIALLIAVILIGKLALVQIVNGERFSERAERQYSIPTANVFDRGQIFFQYKDASLPPSYAAINLSGFTVAINPTLISSPHEVFSALLAFLPDLDELAFFLKAGKVDDPYEEVAHRVSAAVADSIAEQSIPGVTLVRERWRFYPAGARAGHTIGFVGYRAHDFGGRYGVERYYDDTLKRDESKLYVNFFVEMFTNIRQSFLYRAPRHGDIVLTIEPEVQRVLEEHLFGTVQKWNARSAGAVILEPSSGNVRALAAYPIFDPNTFQNEEDYSVFANPVVERVFEFGSIVKPLTVAAGLDNGAITAKTEYFDKGYVIVDDARIENYDGEGRGLVSMQEVLNQSLNTGVVHVVREMGTEKFAEYLLDFGIGEEAGIDLPNEAVGLVDNLKSPREVEFATASFGQGIAATPIAMARALGALANGGFLVTPHVVDRIEYDVGPSKTVSYGDEKRILKKEATEEITRMLVKVVDDALLGGTVKLPRYSIAAKTGTAQIANPDEGGYFDDRYLHSFFGYFPAYDPQFLVFLYVMEPKEVRYASQTLTEPFMNIAKFLIHYYGIAPDR